MSQNRPFPYWRSDVDAHSRLQADGSLLADYSVLSVHPQGSKSAVR